jgi:hypothetical protein
MASNCGDSSASMLKTSLNSGSLPTELFLSRVLCYNWRSVCQSVLVSSTHLGLTTRHLLLSDSYGLLMWGSPSDKRMGLSFIIAAGHRQCSHFRAWAQ